MSGRTLGHLVNVPAAGIRRRSCPRTCIGQCAGVGAVRWQVRDGRGAHARARTPDTEWAIRTCGDRVRHDAAGDRIGAPGIAFDRAITEARVRDCRAQRDDRRVEVPVRQDFRELL